MQTYKVKIEQKVSAILKSWWFQRSKVIFLQEAILCLQTNDFLLFALMQMRAR